MEELGSDKELPVAIAAVTATTAPASASTAAAPVSTTMPAAWAASTTAMPPTPSAAALTLGTRFVYNERPAKEILPVQSRDRFLRKGIVVNFRKAKAARLPGEPVAKKSQRIGLNTGFRK